MVRTTQHVMRSRGPPGYRDAGDHGEDGQPLTAITGETPMRRASVILAIVAFVAGALFGVKGMNAQQAPLPMDDKPFN
jgi:hypothetical protein